MGIRDQTSLSPNSAPAREYVVIPPASLSTFEVMMPGPMRIKKSPTVLHRDCLDAETILL